MSYLLIDNATLTAVQRILGQAQAKSKDSVDGDIASLENLIEAILFYDEIICIDDYKEEYKESRKERFNFIKFIEPEKLQLDKISEKALDAAKEFTPVIRGGEFADEDFRNFFKQLQMHIICTWDIYSSVYYLKLKMLGSENTEEFEKYGHLAAAIFNEMSDLKETEGAFDGKCLLYDSRGQEIHKGYKIQNAKLGGGETGGMTSALSIFVASLNWLTYKSLYYAFAAKYLSADLFIYPIRQAFLIHYMKKKNAYDLDFTTNFLKKLDSALKEELEIILNENRPLPVSLDIPFLAGWLILQTNDVKEVLNAALEIRKHQNFEDARGQLREVRNLYFEADSASSSKKLQKILQDLKKNLQSIRERYGIKTKQTLEPTLLIQVFNIFTALKGWPKIPEFNIKLPKDFLNISNKRGFATLYRDIGIDLSNIARLGEIRDKLGSAVIVTDSGYIPKGEEPEYRNYHSNWKSPM